MQRLIVSSRSAPLASSKWSLFYARSVSLAWPGVGLMAPQAVPTFFQQPRRTFVKSMEDRKEEKDAQAFREDIEYFLSKD